MAIQTKCEHCGHPYAARDELAGKKVRCRQCGLVFTLPAPSDSTGLNLEQDTTGAPDSLSNADLSGSTAIPGYTANRNVGETRYMMPPVTTAESNMSGGVGSAKSQMARPDYDPGEFGIADTAPTHTGIRPARPFTFPMADLMDQWLPWLIVALMLLLSLSVAWSWRPSAPVTDTPDHTRIELLPGWSGALPAALVLLVLLIVWTPLYQTASKQIAKILKFALPDRMGLRSLAMASVPLALGAVFWFNAESTAAGITGIVLGTGLSLLAGWFLLRLQQKEIPFVGIAVAVASIVASIVSALAIWGANFATLQTVKAMRQHQQFAVSPYGPNLEWETPRADQPVVQAPDPAKKSPNQTTASKTTPAPTAPVNPQPTANAGTTVPSTAVKSQPTPPAAEVPPTPANPVGPGGVPVVRLPAPTTPTPATPTPAVKANPRPARQPSGPNPLIADAKALPVDNVSGLLGPITSSPVIAAITDGTAAAADHTIEICKVDPFTTLGQVPFSGDPVQASIAVSPDGDLVARVSRGIVHEVVVRSLSKGAIVRKFTIDPRQTRLLGFVNKTTLLIEKRAHDYALQLLDTSSTRDTDETFWNELPSWMTAVYSDGKTRDSVRVATIVPPMLGQTNAGLRVYNPSNARMRLPLAPIIGIDASIQTKPTGMTFSPDGKQVAVSYEMANTIAVVVFTNLGAPEPQCLGIHQFPLPAGGADTLAAPVIDPTAIEMVAPTAPPMVPQPGMPPMMMPRPMPAPGASATVRPIPAVNNRLTSVDANTWLYAGQYVLDGNNDQVAGSLDSLGVGIGQHMVDHTTAVLLTKNEDGTNKLTQVQLKLPNGKAK